MRDRKNQLLRLVREEKAATATEYAVMLALILIACIAAITAFGQNLGNKYDEFSTTLFP